MDQIKHLYSIPQLQTRFRWILSSDFNDQEKLTYYYQLRDHMIKITDASNRKKITALMKEMMNNIEVQEFMFRIADDELSPQGLPSLELFNKVSMVGRQLSRQNSQEKTTGIYSMPLPGSVENTQSLTQFQQLKYNSTPNRELQSRTSIRTLNMGFGMQSINNFQQNNSNGSSNTIQSKEMNSFNVIPIYTFNQIAMDQVERSQSIQSPISDQFIELVEQCKYEYEQTRLDDAYRYAIEAKLHTHDARYHEHSEYIDDIVTKYDYMIKNLRELECTDWIPDVTKSGITVKYKFPPGTNTASMYMETVIPVNAVRVLALVNEVDLNYLWVPFCRRTYVNKVINRACKVCTSEMYFPLIPNRETVFVGEGIDRLKENGTIVLLSRSVDQDKEFLARNNINIPAHSKFVRLIIHYYIFEIKPIDEHSCSIRAVTNCDPQISMVPQSVLAYIGRKFAHILIAKIVNLAKNFEQSPFYPVFKENHDFYDWLQDKLSKHLGS